MKRGTASAVGQGVVATILTACLLGVGLRLFFPGHSDSDLGEAYVNGIDIGVAVWLAAVGIGVVVGVVSWRKGCR